MLKRGSGGLVTALTSVLEEFGGLWLSSAITDDDRKLAKDGQLLDFPPDKNYYKIRFIHSSETEFNSFYNTISNELLWFCSHYLWSLPEEPNIDQKIINAWNSGYMLVNQKFALLIEDAVEKFDNECVVLLQDYHLLTVASYLRKKLNDLPICHFTHTAWPNPDYFGVLPKNIRDDIFEGMLANNIIGFQSERYAKNFTDCCEAFTDLKYDKKQKIIFCGNDHQVHIRAYPISIDYKTTINEAQSAETKKFINLYTDENKDQMLIVRVERADPAKNTVRGLLSYELMLEKHPELIGMVKHLVLLHASRTDIDLYKKNLESITVMTKKINAKFGNQNWSPIELSVEDNYNRSLAALSLYDVLVINSLFDGMNLVAKEGPVINRKDGVLVLSENTGAYDELKSNILPVNPFDIEQTSEQIYSALIMPSERKKEMRLELVEQIKNSTAEKWANEQIEDLLRVTQGSFNLLEPR